jgi:hypothetical protein
MLIYINLFFVFFCGRKAYDEYKRGNIGSARLNLFASSINLAAVLIQLF